MRHRRSVAPGASIGIATQQRDEPEGCASRPASSMSPSRWALAP